MATKKKASAKTEQKKDVSAKDVLALMNKMDAQSSLKSIALSKKEAYDFVSTGLLCVDLIIGGGQYGGQVLQAYGAEHSGKSTFGYTGAGFLTRELGIPCAFLDHEGTTDRALTEQAGIGVNYDLVKYFRPPTGEAAYDWIFDFCSALPDKHSGLPQAVVYIDTIKAMLPQKYIDSPDNRQPAIEASMHSRGWNRIQTLIANKHVSIVGLNQVRGNVGNPYQSPESVPGGNAWKFATTNLLRLGRGKVLELPNGAFLQEVRFKTYKNKNFIPLQECKVHLELGVGFDVASDVIEFCKLAGYYFKRGKDGKPAQKGLPTIRGLDEILRANGYDGAIEADGDYRSGAELEGIIREWGRKGPIWDACRLALSTGTAIEKFRASKKTESDEADESLIGTKRVKKTTVAASGSSEPDDLDDSDDEEGEEDDDTINDGEGEDEGESSSVEEEQTSASDEEEAAVPVKLGKARSGAAKKAPKRRKPVRKKAS